MKKRLVSSALLLCLCLMAVWATGCTAKTPSYKDGTYNASAQGYGGNVAVTVKVQGGKIASVEATGDSETPDIGSKALDSLPQEIVSANSTKVDSVAGATVTSNAIKNAVDDALKQAAQ